jgi:glycine hydroxymethyltransferase
VSAVAERGDAPLRDVDPEIARLVEAERARQNATLDLVASENFAPLAVREVQGSILTNKYADGYPGDRLYDGCEFVDEIERLAIERAKSLFGAEHANVQPYSGSSANGAVLHALCAPGDPILGFDFSEGGHPSQYADETFAGRFYRGASYGVRRRDRLIDMDEVADAARRHLPKVIFAGGSCYPRHLDFPAFRAIADEVGAYFVCDMAHFSGLVVAGLHPDPVPYADVCTMTVHKTLGGARGGAILCRRALAPAIDDAVFPGEQGAPLMHIIAGKAVTFGLAATPAFADRMARTVAGARTIAGALNDAARTTGVTVVTGGTDVHLVLCDTTDAPFPAEAGLEYLHAVSINANAMRIAYDQAPSGSSSGLRLGATSLATRGFDGAAFEELGDIVTLALGPDRARRHEELRQRVDALVAQFPVSGPATAG